MEANTPNALAPGNKCRVLRLPTDDALVEAINRVLALLVYPGSWVKYGNRTPEETAQFMLEWLIIMRESEHECGSQSSDCGDGCCEEFAANSTIFRYRPSDPFLTPQIVPMPYAKHPFAIVGENPVIAGTQPRDVITSFERLLPSLNPIENAQWALSNIPSWGLNALIDLETDKNLFPRFSFDVEGTGEVELHLLKVPQGGLALISVDRSPAVKVVDLQSFSLGDVNSWLSVLSELGLGFINDIVGTLVSEEIVEISIDDAGSHTVTVTFVPKISGTMLGGLIPEFGWGGGIAESGAMWLDCYRSSA